MNRFKKLFALLLVAALAFSLAACGTAATSTPATPESTAASTETPPATGEQITLEAWHYFELQDGDRFVEMCENYSEVNPNVKVNVTFITREDLLKQYTMGAVSGELPDIGMVDNPDHASFSAMGVFEDITELVSEEELVPHRI